jgi:hypothetical protein
LRPLADIVSGIAHRRIQRKPHIHEQYRTVHSIEFRYGSVNRGSLDAIEEYSEEGIRYETLYRSTSWRVRCDADRELLGIHFVPVYLCSDLGCREPRGVCVRGLFVPMDLGSPECSTIR